MNTIRWIKSHPESALLPIAAVGLAFRLVYVAQIDPWTDEFFSALAIQMVAEKGQPIMPSGLFYTHGLPYSYVGALFVWLFGYSMTVARLPSLLFSLGTLMLIYHAGQRWFSPRVGLLAATALALSPEAIMWGGTARMYAMWQFLSLAAVYFLFEGLRKNGNPYLQAAGAIALGGAIWCHVRTLLTVPPLIAGLVLAWWMSRRDEQFHDWRPRRVPWAGVTSLGLVLASSLLLFTIERPTAIASSDQINLSEWLNPIRLFVDILLGAHQFIIMPYLILTVLALSGLFALLFRLFRRRLRAQDLALVYLMVVGLGILIEYSLVSPPILRIPRYLFDVLPLYLLAVAHELDFLANHVQARLHGAARAVVALLPVLLVIGLFIPPALSRVNTQISAALPALDYVHDHWLPGDRIGTQLPVASYLILSRCDYFVALGRPLVWQKDLGPVDPHLGIPWIGTAEGVRQIARESPRLWLVVLKGSASSYREILEDQLSAPFQGLDYVVLLVEGLP